MERRLRYWGISLLTLGIVGEYMDQWLFTFASDLDWRIVGIPIGIIAYVLPMIGAGLVAGSLIVRALSVGLSIRFVRWLPVVAVVLIAIGALLQSYSMNIIYGIEDYLGPTGQAGSIVVGHLTSILGEVAIPLGIALVPAWLVIRWTQQQERG